MRKIIIQPTRKTGVYQVILLERRGLYFIKWWKEVSLAEYDEETAFLKFTELIEKYNILPGDVYDRSGDSFHHKFK